MGVSVGRPLQASRLSREDPVRIASSKERVAFLTSRALGISAAFVGCVGCLGCVGTAAPGSGTPDTGPTAQQADAAAVRDAGSPIDAGADATRAIDGAPEATVDASSGGMDVTREGAALDAWGEAALDAAVDAVDAVDSVDAGDAGAGGEDGGAESMSGEDGPTMEAGEAGITETVIGAAGGTVTSADGRVRIDIPPGALSQPTAISIAPSSDATSLSALPTPLGDAFVLSPDGLQLNVPATLTVRVNRVPAQALGVVGVAYYDPASGTWKSVDGVQPDTTAGTVSVPITHFSEWDPFDDIIVTPDHVTVLYGGPSVVISLQQVVPWSTVRTNDGQTHDVPTHLSPYAPDAPSEQIVWHEGPADIGVKQNPEGATVRVVSNVVPDPNPTTLTAELDIVDNGVITDSTYLNYSVFVLLPNWTLTADFSKSYTCPGVTYDYETKVTIPFTIDTGFQISSGADATGDAPDIGTIQCCADNPCCTYVDGVSAAPATASNIAGYFDSDSHTLFVTAIAGSFVDVPAYTIHGPSCVPQESSIPQDVVPAWWTTDLPALPFPTPHDGLSYGGSPGQVVFTLTLQP
jgi:hypothetical protein